MDSDTLQAILPALIALAGTLLTVFIGVWQWRKAHTTETSAPFKAERQTAYKGLWEKLEDVHIKLRVDSVNSGEFKSLVQDVNAYIIKNAIYMDESDHTTASQYLSLLREFETLIRSSDNSEITDEWNITGAIPTEVTGTIQELRQLQQRLDQTRNQLLEKCRKVLQGNT